MAVQLKKRVGIALCGFGRAGRIHFNGVRQNYRCELKYVVDLVDAEVTVNDCTLKEGEVVRSTLENYCEEGTKVVDSSEFYQVSLCSAVISCPDPPLAARLVCADMASQMASQFIT